MHQSIRIVIATFALSLVLVFLPGSFLNANEGSMQRDSQISIITYKIGIPTYEGGQTTLSISMNGQVTIHNEHVGQVARCFEGMLNAQDIQLLNQQIERAKLWRQKQRDTAVPGEANVEMTLSQGDQVVHKVLLWEKQFQDSEALQNLKRLLDEYVRLISNDEVY